MVHMLPPTGVRQLQSKCTIVCDIARRSAEADFKTCRLLSKQKQTWQCSACGVKCTQLRRALGKWPTDAFNLLPQDSALDRILRSPYGLGKRLCRSSCITAQVVTSTRRYRSGNWQPAVSPLSQRHA